MYSHAASVVAVVVIMLCHISLIDATKECGGEVVQDDGTSYRVPNGTVVTCPHNFVFELWMDCAECGILKSAYAEANPCVPDVDIMFSNGTIRDEGPQFTHIMSTNVNTVKLEGTERYVGVFNGEDSFIEIPLFRWNEFGARLQVVIRYREDLVDPGRPSEEALVSNSLSDDVPPTLAIIHSRDRKAILAALNTTGGIFTQYAVATTDELEFNWKTITLDYNAFQPSGETAVFSLSETGERSTNNVIGNLKSLNSAIVIGRGAFAAPFKGQIDFIKISRCTPGNALPNNNAARRDSY